MMSGLRVPAPGWVWLGTVIGLGAVLWVMTVGTMHGYAYQRPFVALIVLPFFALLVASGATCDLRGRRWWLNSTPLLRLGEWSFALYLLHNPTYLLTSRWHWWDAPGGFQSLLSFAAYLS